MAMTESRKEFFHALFTTAIEGGIDYWARIDKYHWSQGGEGAMTGIRVPPPDLDGFEAIISSSEGDWGVSHLVTGYGLSENESIHIDLAVVERGWNLFMDAVISATKSEDSSAPCSLKYFRQAIIQYLTDMEEGDSDSVVADIVIQYGLFGEIVYS